MRYRYSQQFFQVEKVTMEAYDSNGRFFSVNMVYNACEHEWYCECDRAISRYKYVINDIIRLNDPLTNHYGYDEKWEIWSVPDGCRVSKAYLSEYNVSNSMVNGAIKKRDYLYDRPIDIYTSVAICRVEGLHSLTYMCFQPDGMLYKLEECSMGQFEQNEADYKVVFKNQISGIDNNSAEGVWSFQVYLDGKRIIQDYFIIKKKVISNMFLLDCRM